MLTRRVLPPFLDFPSFTHIPVEYSALLFIYLFFFFEGGGGGGEWFPCVCDHHSTPRHVIPRSFSLYKTDVVRLCGKNFKPLNFRRPFQYAISSIRASLPFRNPQATIMFFVV